MHTTKLFPSSPSCTSTLRTRECKWLNSGVWDSNLIVLPNVGPGHFMQKIIHSRKLHLSYPFCTTACRKREHTWFNLGVHFSVWDSNLIVLPNDSPGHYKQEFLQYFISHSKMRQRSFINILITLIKESYFWNIITLNAVSHPRFYHFIFLWFNPTWKDFLFYSPSIHLIMVLTLVNLVKYFSANGLLSIPAGH